MNDALRDPGLIDGRYRLDVELGCGAFGTVYKAEQMVLDRPMRTVALKLFRGESVRAENVEQMLNEALQIQGLLECLGDWQIRQHFVTVYDLGMTQDAAPRGFVAMELVRGGSLQGRIHDGRRFSLHGALHYLRQIARALSYMHTQGLVHSDLKPENILVFRGSSHDLVKIGDFGLSGKYLGPLADGPRGGTLSYLAPEALAGFATTPGADVFSLGLIAYQMLNGTNPYDRVGQTLDPKHPEYRSQLSEMHRMSREAPLRVHPDAYPELKGLGSQGEALAGLLDVVNRMLAPDLSQRYVSARAVHRDLERIAAGRLPQLATEESGPPAVDDLAEPREEPVVERAEPEARLVERFEYCLAREDWAAAGQAASELRKAAPGAARGYLFKSRLARRQADLEREPDLAHRLRQQAVRVLNRGLNQCEASQERRELRAALVELYEEMGDDETARKIRDLCS